VPPIVSCRHYKPGDQISYYITATPKKIPAYEAAKLASEFDPEKRDENVDYYVAKLDELVKKFRGRASRMNTRFVSNPCNSNSKRLKSNSRATFPG
jgi:DNA polymerase elongation subunit (family B)